MTQRLISALAISLLLAGSTAAQDRKTFRVGTASAAGGQKVTGTIEVPLGSDVALSIPVAVIHGAKPGPVLALVAGSHGTEYTSIIALEKVIAQLNPADISGTLKIFMVDAGVMLDKIVIDMGGLRPSYLGPPETRCKTLNSPWGHVHETPSQYTT